MHAQSGQVCQDCVFRQTCVDLHVYVVSRPWFKSARGNNRDFQHVDHVSTSNPIDSGACDFAARVLQCGVPHFKLFQCLLQLSWQVPREIRNGAPRWTCLWRRQRLGWRSQGNDSVTLRLKLLCKVMLGVQIIKSRHQAQPEPETDFEPGAVHSVGRESGCIRSSRAKKKSAHLVPWDPA